MAVDSTEAECEAMEERAEWGAHRRPCALLGDRRWQQEDRDGCEKGTRGREPLGGGSGHRHAVVHRRESEQTPSPAVR